MKKAEIITKWSCESCGKRHDRESSALECCPPEASEVYICSVCTTEFWSFTEATDHLELPHTGNGLETSKDRYFEQVLIEGQPTLGQWAFEMQEDKERWLIPA